MPEQLYQLVRDYVSHDVVDSLDQLSLGAHSGDVIGIAFVALLKGRRYIVNASGRCLREATFTRGAAFVLSDHLSEIIHGRDPDETR